MRGYDVIVSGAGPAGASAAWQAATSGARVLVCDRAAFPRDKPCGDGITPRAVRLLAGMGLSTDIDRFHKVDKLRVTAEAGALDLRWPERPGLPRFGYVAPRTEFDTLLVEAAGRAGAEVRTNVDVVGPIVEGGTVCGVRTRTAGGSEEEISGTITIAADGMSSRLCSALGMTSKKSDTFAVAVRAQVGASRPDDRTLECFVNLQHGMDLLPGYGWVFPMGDGRINIGVGYMTSYARWREVNAPALMSRFVDSLPDEWEVPQVDQHELGGWRLPMGLTVWPPWRPGLMAAGDAIGAAKPFTGAGISKAIQTGALAAQVATNTLAWGDPADLKAYEAGLDAMWGGYYRIGRRFVGLLGKPKINRAVVNTGMRAGLFTDFFVTMFTGNGEASADRSGMHPRIVAKMMRAAQVGGGRQVNSTDRSAKIHPSRVRPRVVSRAI